MLTGAALAHRCKSCASASAPSAPRYRKAELFARGIADGATLAPVNTVADVLAPRASRGAPLLAAVRLRTDGRVLRAPGAVRAAARRRRSRSTVRRRRSGEQRRSRCLGRPAPRPPAVHRRRSAGVRGRPALRRHQGRRLLLDRRRADHRQVPRRPRRDGGARRDREPGRSAAPRRSVQGQRPGAEPLPVLRLVQYVEAVAGAQPQEPRRPRGREAADRRGPTSASTRSRPAPSRTSGSATTSLAASIPASSWPAPA